MKHVFTILLLSVLAQVHAQTNTIDNTFGLQGVDSVNLHMRVYYSPVIFSSCLQADGKIIAIGEVSGSKYGFVLMRWLSNGILDTNFAYKGIDTSIRMGITSGMHLIIQKPDGKFLIAGAIRHKACMMQYTTNGQVDSTFGFNGIDTLNVPDNFSASTISLLKSGKILLAGSAKDNSGYYDCAVVRLNTDYTLDTTFGAKGIALTYAFGSAGINDMAVQPDGEIVGVGDGYDGTNDHFVTVRYDSTGQPDPYFGSGGLVVTSISTASGSADAATAMAIQPDRKIVVTGYSYAGCAVVRYNLDGTVDSTFGNYGRVVNNLNIGAVSNTLVLQSDGKILVAGNGGKGEQQSLLIRLTATGQLDNTFCHNGIDTEAFGCQLADYQTINIQPDGKIVLAGNAGKWYNAGPIAKYFIVTRYIDDDNIGTVNIKSTDNTSLIYPNPTSAFITLRYTVPEEGVMCMNLYDLEGNLIKTISPAQQYKPGCNTMKVDMSNLSSGTYIIVIQNAQGGKTQVKVVKE